MDDPAGHVASLSASSAGGGAWIVYRSSAVTAPNAMMLLDIIRSSERNNAAEGISGMLAYDAGGAFAQLLEGPATALRSRFVVIAGDDRHVIRWWRSGTLDDAPFTLGLPMGYIDLDMECRDQSEAVRKAGPEDAQALAQRLRLLARVKYPRAIRRGMPQA